MPDFTPYQQKIIKRYYDNQDIIQRQRLADELAKANGWVPLVSPNTVKRILRDAGLWSAPAARAQRGGRAARTAQPTNPAKPSM